MLASALVLAIANTQLAHADYQRKCLESQVVDMQKPQLRGKGHEVRYTGHGNDTGGLQRHSIGPEYQYTIIGVQRGPEGALRWAVMDTRNGQIGADKATHRECEIEVYSLKLRNMMHS